MSSHEAESTGDACITSKCSVFLFAAVVDCERWAQQLAARVGSIINI